MGFKDSRLGMVKDIGERYCFEDDNVLRVMREIPRHEFAPRKYWDISYDDSPVDLGCGQTMSQPYTVAIMTKLATEFQISNYQFPNKSQITNTGLKNEIKTRVLELGTPLDSLQHITGRVDSKHFTVTENVKENRKFGKVLEIGTGSGYQAAVLSYFFNKVYTVEIIPELSIRARTVLAQLGYKNVFVKMGSGEIGWKEKAPFDAIMITAGVDKVPKELFKQLKVGGVLVAPVGKGRDKMMTRFIKLKTQKSKVKITNQKSKLKKLRNIELKKEVFGMFHFVPFVKLRSD